MPRHVRTERLVERERVVELRSIKNVSGKRYIALELFFERIDALKPLLGTNQFNELHNRSLAVEIIVEIDEMGFNQ